MRSVFVIAVSTLGAALVLMVSPVFDDDIRRRSGAGDASRKGTAEATAGCRVGCEEQGLAQGIEVPRHGAIRSDPVR